MRKIIENFLLNYIGNNEVEKILVILLIILMIITIGLLANFIMKKIILRIILKLVEKTENKWDDMVFNDRIFSALAHLAPVVTIFLFKNEFKEFGNIVSRIMQIYILWIVTSITNSLLSSGEDIYNSFEVSKSKPIKSYIQTVRIVVYIFSAIIFIATITSKSPWALLSGIGAMTAVLLLVFKDTILGVVAGIQLSAHKMVKIGDWIEVPNYNANGDVIEINITTLKVENFDKTISVVPVYQLISNSFKNWSEMQRAGGRRIKRAVSIDIKSVKFCDKDMIEKFKKIKYISKHLEDRLSEIDNFNQSLGEGENITINGRRLTNLGVFRSYLSHYLKNNDKINQNMTSMVRQLASSEKGVPLEIYCFSKSVNWIEYEELQSDIFDHIFSVANEFDLDIFQYSTKIEMSREG